MEKPIDGSQFVLEDVIAKSPQEVSEEEKTYLSGQYDNLTDDERDRFGVKKAGDDKGDEGGEGDDKDKDKKPPELPKPETRRKEEEPKDKDKDKDDDDDDIDDEDKKIMDKRIAKHLDPIKNQLTKSEQEKMELQTKVEVDDFVNENPDFKDFKKTIIEFANHPAYKNIPISFIANGIAADRLKQIGAEQERVAQRKAKGTDNGGNGGNGKREEKPGQKSVWEMTPQEFQDYKNGIKGYNR